MSYLYNSLQQYRHITFYKSKTKPYLENTKIYIYNDKRHKIKQWVENIPYNINVENNAQQNINIEKKISHILTLSKISLYTQEKESRKCALIPR